ncbi:MAG: ABC transporter substrate-binding protein [Desulfomonile tiedjei]|uniref:ABC transporter substrate-binding protein n=1 Tax=Desulfomonile tiedjei TaxID=2358 RepID=A0A9D6V6M0_9BACT|nr:ABC transporter substrate-binding protein [Desulfomonile tiedjei]
MRFRPIFASLIVAAVVAMSGLAQAQESAKIRFGVLPVLQALPLFVAQDKGIFTKHGVNVELIPFNTAAEKDIALTTGSIDGYFGDLLTAIVLKANGRDVMSVATNYDTRKDRRMFAVLGKPGGKYKSAADLVDVPVAVSSNSVIDYVTSQLLTSKGVPEDKVASIEAKNIGLRMQLLLSGQVEAATLPEPLVTAALAKGAVLLADDSGLGESQTVLVFSGPFMKKNGKEVKAFLAAQNEANNLVSADPDSIRGVMVEHVRLPEPLKATYPVPHFPKLFAPDKEAVQAIVKWLHKRGVITTALTYEQVVDAGYLP